MGVAFLLTVVPFPPLVTFFQLSKAILVECKIRDNHCNWVIHFVLCKNTMLLNCFWEESWVYILSGGLILVLHKDGYFLSHFVRGWDFRIFSMLKTFFGGVGAFFNIFILVMYDIFCVLKKVILLLGQPLTHTEYLQKRKIYSLYIWFDTKMYSLIL